MKKKLSYLVSVTKPHCHETIEILEVWAKNKCNLRHCIGVPTEKKIY